MMNRVNVYKYRFKRFKFNIKMNSGDKLDKKGIFSVIISNLIVNLIASILVVLYFLINNLPDVDNKISILQILIMAISIILLFWNVEQIIKSSNKNEAVIGAILTPVFLLLIPKITKWLFDTTISYSNLRKHKEVLDYVTTQLNNYEDSYLYVAIILLVTLLPLLLDYVKDILSDNREKTNFYKWQRNLYGRHNDEQKKQLINSLRLEMKIFFDNKEDFFDFFTSFSNEKINIYDIVEILKLINYNIRNENLENYILGKVNTSDVNEKILSEHFFYDDIYEIKFLKIESDFPIFDIYTNSFQVKITKL
ncbi:MULTISPECIES: hypothetical protein [unclassified Enterococcus]|uniref:hypothetical protein n=2 Tax=Enterococcus TaxID=1350 RepID=UPI001906947E|nr:MULTISPECIES: hypothetical protein [unclassified Enterococcus]MBK0069128.1 hypothetical protein [Enterococcus sp. S53]MBK0139721.1 hypothetical protein [Enterococcus sp. S76]